MEAYKILLYSRARRDIREIYTYISEHLQEPETAKKMLDALEKAVSGLAEMPTRGAQRKHGVYADQGYRQIFVKNYTIVYYIAEAEREARIVTVQYSGRAF